MLPHVPKEKGYQFVWGGCHRASPSSPHLEAEQTETQSRGSDPGKATLGLLTPCSVLFLLPDSSVLEAGFGPQSATCMQEWHLQPLDSPGWAGGLRHCPNQILGPVCGGSSPRLGQATLHSGLDDGLWTSCTICPQL